MFSYKKLLILVFLIQAASFILPAQPIDSLHSSKAYEPGNVLPVKDTMPENKDKQSKNGKYIPDTIYLKNGDRITGRIISFEQGRLKMDAQGPSVITIKWHKIATISGGSRAYKLEDVNGIIYIGFINPSADTSKIFIVSEHTNAFMLEDIVRMFPLEEEWYRGFKGNLGAGVSYAKSSDVLTINGEYNLYYVISKWKFVNNFSYISTKSTDEAASLRIQGDFQALYSLPGRWVLSEINSYNRNDELGIKSRFTFGLGGGYDLVQTEKQRLLALTGINHSSEQDIESSSLVSNLEWPISIRHIIYSFARPDLTSTTSLAYYAGITDQGRSRFDASTDITWEFVKDVKLKLTVYYNFDNKVVEGKPSEEDYGTVLSLIVDLK